MKRTGFLIGALMALAVPAAAQAPDSVTSPDGKLIARIVHGEGDWRSIDVTDAATGQKRPDHIEYASFTTVVWAPDGSGFYYSRQPKPWDDPALQIFNTTHSVEFHRLGTSQEEDEDVYSTDRAKMFHTVQMTQDGRWLVITSSENHDPHHEIVLINRQQPLPAPFKLIRGLDAAWWFAGNRGDTLYFVTTKNAPKGRLVSIDVNATVFAVRDVVKETADTLSAARLTPAGVELTYDTGVKTLSLPENAQ